MDIVFLSQCRNCRRIRLFTGYTCSVCDTVHSRRLRDKKRIKDDQIRDVVLKTQERFCAQCRKMVPLNIVTEREMLGLLTRKYPRCPECEMDLSDEALEITISMFNDLSIYYNSFKLEDMRLCLTLAVLLRHFKDFSPEEETFREDFFEWKKLAVSTIVENIIEIPVATQMALSRFLLDFKSRPELKLNEKIIEHFNNIDVKLDLLAFFGYSEEVPAVKEDFLEKLEDVKIGAEGIEQEPVVLPPVEMYKYDNKFTLKSEKEDDDEDEEEDDEDEDEEDEDDGGKKGAFERILNETEVDVRKLAFQSRTTETRKRHGKVENIAEWHAMLVIDNAGRSVYLYRPEGFVPKEERYTSFESKRLLDSIITTQAVPEKDAGDVFSPSFFDKLPCNDICYISKRLDKTYLASYTYHDLVFGPGENRDFIAKPPAPAEGFHKPEPRDEMVEVIMDHGDEVKRYKRVGLCEKCAGITRPFLKEKWECPECGARDSAETHYCSNCASKIEAGDSMCGNCGEYLV